MPVKIAADVMRPHHDQLARAIARHVRQVVPRYRQVDDAVLEKNLLTLLRGVQSLLENDDDRWLLSMVRDVAQIRALSGFRTQDFLMAGLCFLPVIRRLLLLRCRSTSEALSAYEGVEAVAIPFFGRITQLFESTQSGLFPDTDEITLRDVMSSVKPRMEIAEDDFAEFDSDR